MLKKTIKYVDYDGNEREEDFYFNMSKAEVMMMEMGVVGGFGELLKRIIARKDIVTIMKTFEEIISKSYGEKSLDGKHFVKSPDLSKAFTETEAYSELIMELLSDTTAAAAFVNAVLPDVGQMASSPALTSVM